MGRMTDYLTNFIYDADEVNAIAQSASNTNTPIMIRTAPIPPDEKIFSLKTEGQDYDYDYERCVKTGMWSIEGYSQTHDYAAFWAEYDRLMFLLIDEENEPLKLEPLDIEDNLVVCEPLASRGDTVEQPTTLSL